MLTKPAHRRGVSGLLGTAALALFGGLLAGGMSAAPASAAPAQGWVRLAHLSPDTPAVDVSLTALGADGARLALQDVAYGDVSAYQRVPAGTYAASMVPAGAPAGSTPVLTKTLEVGAGGAFTVAAVGRNAQLTSTVLTDDLDPPEAGAAKVRLLQASVTTPAVDVSARGGPVVARDAGFGSATTYAQVPSGAWDLDVSATDQRGDVQTSRVDLPGGSVNTLFVLDGDGGRLRVKAVSDSSGLAAMPAGGVQTGGGALAARASSGTGPRGVVLPALAVVLAAGGAVVLRRHRGMASA